MADNIIKPNMVDFGEPEKESSIIKVIGVGGGGGNAVNHMYREGIHDVSFVLCNTDAQALNDSPVPVHLQLGKEGLGAGNKPEKARQAAEESLDDIKNMLNDGTKMAFITAGMGGGTGTGAAPVIAKVSKEMGILTVGVVTKPFSFEGKKRKAQADLGLDFLKKYVDSLVIVPNDKLLENCEKNTTMIDAFAMADDVLRQGVQGISDLISDFALINVDFADVRSVMTDRGVAHMGVGHGSGEDRAKEAVKAAIESPLLETRIDGAKAILLYVSGGYDLGMMEVNEIASLVEEQADNEAILIFGASVSEEMNNEISITVIATGFEDGQPGPDTSDFKLPESARSPRKIVTEDGINGTEVTLEKIFEGAREEDPSDSKFDIPTFLNTK